jgi:hypothetical protein
MTSKTIATLFILSTFATAGAISGSAQGADFKGGGFHRGGGGRFHGRGFHKQNPPAVVGGYVYGNGYGDGNGYGGDNANGNDNGYGNWYGISPGHDECPLFRQPVTTPDGWRVQMVPNC